METIEYTIETMEDADLTQQDTTPMLSSASAAHEDPLSMRDTILAFAEKYSINLAAKRFHISPNVIKKWLKSENIQMRPKFNSPGQGRKISYSKETDEAISAYVKEVQAAGENMSVQELCAYAKDKIQLENPPFNASTGWAQRFLLRHGLDLGTQAKARMKRNSDEEPRSGIISDTRGRPLSYSNDTDLTIAGYVRNKHAQGHTVTNSELRKYAKELVLKENPSFTGSASWAQNFLLRHKLSLNNSPPTKEESPSTSMALHLTDSPSPSLPTISAATMADPLQPDADMAPTSAPPVVSDLTSEYSTEDPMKAALAILTGENVDTTLLNSVQAAALQTTLNELTSDSVSLVELLNNAQQLQEHGSGEGAVALITHGFDSPGSSGALYLTLPGTSEAFSGLIGAAATQVNPNTQTPTLHTPHLVSMRPEPQETGQASRPLSYTKETDQALANWVQEQQAAGKKVTFASLRSYAKKLVSSENPNFNASVGWVTPFLLRHNLDLSVNKKKKTPRKSTPRKIEASTPDGLEDKLLEGSESVEEGASDQNDTESPTVDDLNPGTTAVTGLMTPEHNTPSVLPPGPLGDNSLPQQAVSAQGEQPMDTSNPDVKFTPKKVKGQRIRHTLSEKLEVVKLMREHNMAAHYVCRMLGIANSTIAGWIKLVQQKGAELEHLSSNKKRANVSGQGRPLSYSREKDEVIARWVKTQQELGLQITPTELAKYATSIIGQENSSFTASSGWQQKFLQRHGLLLAPKGDKVHIVEDQRNIPAPVQTEEVITHEFSTNILEKPYSDEIDQQLTQWAKGKVMENGSLAVQSLCEKAEEMIVHQNPMFVATLGWAFKFLLRRTILLDPKPVVSVVDSPAATSRKRQAEKSLAAHLCTPKKLRPDVPDLSVSPSTGNLCEALLALSNQTQDGVESPQTIQAAVQAMQSAVEAMQQQSESERGLSQEQAGQTTSTYFGKPAREFTSDEKEEVVRYANATTLQKAALKYGVAAPTVWRWRVELKLHQPKYTPMQKKYIIKFAETNSLREASQRYGITGKTVQNWRKALQAEGELPSSSPLIEDSSAQEVQGESEGGDVVTYDTQSFQFVVDGGEVVDTRDQNTAIRVNPIQLEVTHEVDIENVGMEYDVISSEGHAAKPRCTMQEKMQILQYALEHSIKEASQKFGISPGTLYYWKKTYSSGGFGVEKATSQSPTATTTPTLTTSADVAPAMTAESAGTAKSVMSVQYAGISGSEASVMPTLNPAISLESLVIPTDQLLSSDAAATPENLQALSQTLANMSQEDLQNLPADISLLQAVSNLLSNNEGDGEGDFSRKLRLITARRHESNSGEISSPTEVLVPPFQPPPTSTSEPPDTAEQVLNVLSTEEVTVSESSELPSEETVAQPAVVPTTELKTSEVGSAQDQPSVVEESIEVQSGAGIVPEGD